MRIETAGAPVRGRGGSSALEDLSPEVFHRIVAQLDCVEDRGRLGMVSRRLREYMLAFPWSRRDYPGFLLHQKPARDDPASWLHIIAQRRLLMAAPLFEDERYCRPMVDVVKIMAEHHGHLRYLHALASAPLTQPGYLAHFNHLVGDCLAKLGRLAEAEDFCTRALLEDQFVGAIARNDLDTTCKMLAAGQAFHPAMAAEIFRAQRGINPAQLWATDAWLAVVAHLGRLADHSTLACLLSNPKFPRAPSMAAAAALPSLSAQAIDRVLAVPAEQEEFVQAVLAHPALVWGPRERAEAIRRDLIGAGRIPSARLAALASEPAVMGALEPSGEPPLALELMSVRRPRKQAPTHRRLASLLALYPAASRKQRANTLLRQSWQDGQFIVPQVFALRQHCLAAYVSSGGRLSLTDFFALTPAALTHGALYHHPATYEEMVASGRHNFRCLLATLLDMGAIDLAGGFGPHLALRPVGMPPQFVEETKEMENMIQARTPADEPGSLRAGERAQHSP